MSRRTGVVALALAFLLLSGCGASQELEALKDDPIADYQPSDGRLVESDEQNEGSFLGMGKPNPAESPAVRAASR